MPDVLIFYVPQRGRINVIQSHGEKGLTIRSDEPPPAIAFTQGKECLLPGSFALC
jgi:hypothetical protein